MINLILIGSEIGSEMMYYINNEYKIIILTVNNLEINYLKNKFI